MNNCLARPVAGQDAHLLNGFIQCVSFIRTAPHAGKLVLHVTLNEAC